jgi:gliding motility-associated-like protein
MVNTTTGCINSAGTATLKVAAGALIGTPATWGVCDYEFTSPNGVTTFDLTQLDAQVLMGQAPVLFTTAYFTSLADATLGVNAISNLSTYQTSDTTIWIVVTNMTTLCRSDIKTISLVVEPLAEPVITSSTGSNTICVEWITGTATDPLLSGLTLDSGITAPNYSFQWSLDGTPIPGAINATYTINTVAPGDYSVVATSVNPPLLGCVSNQSAIFTVIKSGPAVIIGTGYEEIIAFEDIQNIIVTVQGYGTYHYQLDNGPILDNGGVFENVPYGTHTITVHDVKGNTPCDNLVISNISVINYPHFFTPNGDGINDEWNIVGLIPQPNAKIYIFDRFGKLMKQISSTGTGWNGFFNGEPMPATDYWFTVEYLELGLSKTFKAHQKTYYYMTS